MNTESTLPTCSRGNCDNPGEIDHGTFRICRFHNAEAKKWAQSVSAWDEGFALGAKRERERIAAKINEVAERNPLSRGTCEVLLKWMGEWKGWQANG